MPGCGRCAAGCQEVAVGKGAGYFVSSAALPLRAHVRAASGPRLSVAANGGSGRVRSWCGGRACERCDAARRRSSLRTVASHALHCCAAATTDCCMASPCQRHEVVCMKAMHMQMPRSRAAATAAAAGCGLALRRRGLQPDVPLPALSVTHSGQQGGSSCVLSPEHARHSTARTQQPACTRSSTSSSRHSPPPATTLKPPRTQSLKTG